MLQSKKWVLGICLVAASSLYVLLAAATVSGEVIYAILLAWLASPILFPVLALIYERFSVEHGGRGGTAKEVMKSVFSHKTQAWSFLYGDTLILPLAFALAAGRWHEAASYRTVSVWWFVLCLVVGLLVGYGFHYKMETPGYTKAGFAESLNSPTKLFHDFVTYPALFGGLLFALGPLIVGPEWPSQVNFHTVAILALVGCWAFVGMKWDSERAQKGLIPWGHPRFDLDQLSVL